jgi:hypothetical protein
VVNTSLVDATPLDTEVLAALQFSLAKDGGIGAYERADYASVCATA